MSEQSSAIVSKVWGMCNPLRDDGVSYGDYLEQLTYLIFLKMSDEYSRPPKEKPGFRKDLPGQICIRSRELNWRNSIKQL